MSGEIERNLAQALWPLIKCMRRDATATKNAAGKTYKPIPDQALTPDRLLQHLNGGPARGCYVMKPGTVTMVGVLDLDSHKGETPWAAMVGTASSLFEALVLLGGSPIAFRSGGGSGIHLYCLWAAPQDAYSVREWLLTALRSCGYESGTSGVKAGQVEVFPKRDEVREGGYGHQVFLPLGGKSVPMVWEELAGELVTMPRESAVGMAWPVSEPVTVLERPVRAPRAAGGEVGEDLRVVSEALQAISTTVNAGKRSSWDHDAWCELVQALHKVSSGSEIGRDLAHEWSAGTAGYDEKTEARLDVIWDTSDADREDGVGLGTIMRVARECGWNEPIDISGFEDISAQDSRPPVAAVEWDDSPMPDGGAVEDEPVIAIPPVPPAPPTPPRMLAKLKHRGIPEARHLTTDQANARRLTSAFGNAVMVAAGKWRVWDGRHWKEDESDVYRYACRLSTLIQDEAKVREAKGRALLEVDPADVDGKREIAVAAALMKWAQKSEMKATIEAAVGLARKMMTREVGDLDRDPFALNVLNGTVDLRTGVLRRHDPGDYITKLVPVAYRADAVCPTWDRMLREITRESGTGRGSGVADFLQRWFGYCLTADVREQVFVVHWGSGSNGKSTVLAAMAATSGDYAGTAAPGLLAASKNDRHPTEIAALFGRRTVTAHESSDNVVLREDFIKQATGGDKITARFMREDFFEFDPTHKIQLLTNHKPQIRGQDEGIWRRVLLVPYLASFGTAEEVAIGKHAQLKDMTLVLALQDELEGILAWRVRGCLAWFEGGGLNPPATVRAASTDYRVEQDRVGQFVRECCEVGLEWSEPLTEGLGSGLYPAYVGWCKDGGVFPLSKVKFVDEVLRVVVGGRAEDRLVSVTGGGRRKVKNMRGLRLLQE